MTSDDRSFLSAGTFVAAAAAMFLALFAAAAVAGPPEITVTLTEFGISPAQLNIPVEGAKITIVNNGNMAHNFGIPELGLVSEDIAPSQSSTHEVRPKKPGTFDMLCTIPGHADSGMKGSVTVGGAATGATGATGVGEMMGGQPAQQMTAEEMDNMMDEVANQFPAATEGLGGQILEPKMLADGTKEFDLTAKIVDWEVSPGKIVKAWTYNGTVPGPEIRVAVGDRIRIVLHNELPESTALHFHGVRVPNEFDGVPPYTQEPIKPGETFVYEFETLEPAVGMYHSHHNAQVQVPNGLAGALLIGEMPLPASLADEGITKVDHQVTMVLNDAGTIGLSLNGKSFPGTAPYTMKVGETMLVNYFNEGLMSHPMHMHQPVGWIIAKDGVPLEVPMPSDTISVAPGERYTVVYLAKDTGVWAWHCHILNHAEGTQGMFGMVTAVIVEPAA
jgi:manganese oxidase